MKKLWCRICSMVLAICITANLLPLTVWADQVNETDSQLTVTEETELLSDRTSTQAKIVDEVIENRTEFTKEFLLDSGLSLAVVYDSAVHYEKDGQWEEIDNTLKSNLSGTYTNTAGVWDVSFPKQMSANKQISITKDGYTLSFAMAGELLKQGNLEVMSYEEPLEAATQSVSERSAFTIMSVDPEKTVPETTAPTETTPETTEPEETVPETTAPSETIPEDTVPEVTVPEETVPETTVPEETNPTEATFPEIVPTEAVVAPSVPTVSVTVNGKVETFAVNTAKTSAGQIQQIDLGKVRAEVEHQETILQKPYSQLLYSDVYTNTNVQYDLIGNQVKESIILESHNTSLRGFQFTLNTGKLIPILEDDGHIDFYDESRKNIVMTMPAPYLVDSSFEHSDDVNVSISGKDGAYTLTYILPQQWLSSSERAWPVILDPVIKASIDINNIQDVTVGSKKSRGYTNGINACGVSQTYGVQRCYLQYVDLPELKASDVIVSATVRMYKPESSSAAKSVMVHKVNSTWASDTMTWSNKPEHNPLIEDFVRAQNENFYYWEITDIVRQWYTGENTGMVFKVADSVEAKTNETSWREFYSSDYGGPASKPTLEIYFRNNNGLEGYWDYTSSTAGRAGTGYVNQYTGNLTWVHQDLGFGGSRMPVSISHVYNANDNTNAAFGMGNGWRTNFNQSVYQWSKGNDYYVWEDSDGTAHYFKEDTSAKYIDEDGLGLTLKVINSENGKYSITDKKGNISYFDTNGRLTKQLKDQKEDSFIEITYTTETGKLIDTITDGVGRNYKFTYNTDNLLTRISYTGKEPETEGAADPEITYVAFEYTGGNLSKITDADNKSVT